MDKSKLRKWEITLEGVDFLVVEESPNDCVVYQKASVGYRDMLVSDGTASFVYMHLFLQAVKS